MIRRTFTLPINGMEYSWNIEKLWNSFESLTPIDWEIPQSFKNDWSWGQSHPSEHLERCLEADLSYPILVWDGIIIDGCHRAIKSLALGQNIIKAKIITNIPPPDVQEDIEDPIKSNKDVPWTYNDMIKLIKVYMEYETKKKYVFRHPLDGV